MALTENDVICVMSSDPFMTAAASLSTALSEVSLSTPPLPGPVATSAAGETIGTLSPFENGSNHACLAGQ